MNTVKNLLLCLTCLFLFSPALDATQFEPTITYTHDNSLLFSAPDREVRAWDCLNEGLDNCPE